MSIAKPTPSWIDEMTRKVFVSGCFDMLHSGHVAFFRDAARYGDVYVALGSDQTIYSSERTAHDQ